MPFPIDNETKTSIAIGPLVYYSRYKRCKNG